MSDAAIVAICLCSLAIAWFVCEMIVAIVYSHKVAVIEQKIADLNVAKETCLQRSAELRELVAQAEQIMRQLNDARRAAPILDARAVPPLS